ncbi:MAG: hypothetical protein WBA42_02505 [Mesorhizobium sp.]
MAACLGADLAEDTTAGFPAVFTAAVLAPAAFPAFADLGKATFASSFAEAGLAVALPFALPAVPVARATRGLLACSYVLRTISRLASVAGGPVKWADRQVIKAKKRPLIYDA